jgi:hypothetical protein
MANGEKYSPEQSRAVESRRARMKKLNERLRERGTADPQAKPGGDSTITKDGTSEED